MSQLIQKGYYNYFQSLAELLWDIFQLSAFQLVDFSAVNEASLFAMPDFAFLHSKPVFNLEVAAIMVPVAIVTITEHIGDHLVLGSIVGRDLTKNPGLHRTLIGDGVAHSSLVYWWTC